MEHTGNLLVLETAPTFRGSGASLTDSDQLDGAQGTNYLEYSNFWWGNATSLVVS